MTDEERLRESTAHDARYRRAWTACWSYSARWTTSWSRPPSEPRQRGILEHGCARHRHRSVRESRRLARRARRVDVVTAARRGARPDRTRHGADRTGHGADRRGRLVHGDVARHRRPRPDPARGRAAGVRRDPRPPRHPHRVAGHRAGAAARGTGWSSPRHRSTAPRPRRTCSSPYPAPKAPRATSDRSAPRVPRASSARKARWVRKASSAPSAPSARKASTPPCPARQARPARPVPSARTGPTGPVGPQAQWTQLTQAAYDALPVKDPAVLYVIIG